MVFPGDTPICSPGACMWINTHGSHLNLAVYPCQIFLGLFFHRSVNTSPESCQLSSKGSMLLRCSSHCRDGGRGGEREIPVAWQPLSQTCTLSSCSHVAVLLPLKLAVPAVTWSPWATSMQTCLQAGICHGKPRDPTSAESSLALKPGVGPKFCMGPVTYLRGK